MADIWIFILPVFCLLLLALIYFLHKHYISKEEGSPGDTDKNVDDTEDHNIPLNEEPVQPIKAARKNRKKPQDPAQSDERAREKRDETERLKHLGNDYGQTFIEEFDKRDARRKQLKKENEERLRSLLNWSSPFSDGIAQKKNYSDSEKYKKVSFVDIDLPRIKKESVVDKCRAEAKQEEFTNLKENQSNKVKEKRSLAGLEVRKIINFVAITSRQVAPTYKPRNRLNSGTSDTMTQPQRVERRRRVPTPTPRKRVKLLTPEVSECREQVEAVADIVLEAPEEEASATVNKVSDMLTSAEVTLVATSFNFEKEPPRTSSLEFTQYKRNFVTDRLFAGNIYVGEGEQQQQQDLEERQEEEGREEKCSSWRERYQRKMSC